MIVFNLDAKMEALANFTSKGEEGASFFSAREPMAEKKDFGQYGWFIGAASCLAGAIVIDILPAALSLGRSASIPMFVVVAVLLAAAIVLSIFGMARSSHVFKGLSIACCAAVVPLVGLTLFVGGPSIYGSRPSIYDGDPSTFVAGYERHDHWVTVNGERYDYELYDVDGKVKDAIQSARYEKLPESPKLDQEKRWCDFYVPYDDAAYVEVSEEGYAWIYILPDGPFSSSTYGYYSLEPSVASDIVNLAEEVVADGKSVHEEARQKAEAEGDLSHFLKAVSKLNTPWVENLADGCSRYVKDNGSVLSAIKGAAHTLNPSLSAGKYSEELLIYNNDSWYASNLPGWSYVLFTKKTIAKVQRRFTDANGSDGWVSMSYGLPYSDGEAIWNALVALPA